jgi:hypothetical protein
MDDKQLKEAEASLAKLNREWKEAEQVFRSICDKTGELRDAITKEKLDRHFAEGITPEKILSGPPWWAIAGEWHQKLTNWISKNYFDRGVHASGYYPETDQLALRIKLDQRQPLDGQLGILDFIPFIKPHSKGENRDYKKIGIFEASLSEFGSWALLLSSTETILVHQRQEKQRFSSVREALQYIYKHLPYERI